jgi:4-amino-4-deoxy-L-arabinose transferase-like glycosyltransferase
MLANKEIITNKKFLFIFGIAFFALVLRLYFFVGIGFNDDSYYLEYTEKIYRGLNFVPPLYIWPIRIGIYLPIVMAWKLFGISEYSTSLLFLLYSISIVVVTYSIGKELFNDGIALLASLLISTFPIEIIYSTQIGPDVPFQLFAALSILYFFKSYKRERRYKIYFFMSGLFLGIANLFKEQVVLIFFCYCSYLVLDFIAKRKLAAVLNKKVTKGLVIFLFGFLIIYLAQSVYFYSLTDQWFYGEKAKAETLQHDGNRNDDFKFYPNVLLNLDNGKFEWIHNKPLFGYVYWYVLFGIAVLAFQRRFSKNNLFLVFWLLIFYLFLQYGLHFISTYLVENGMRVRHRRFLIPMSIPAALLIAQALYFTINSGTINKVIKSLLLLFLVLSSIFFTHQSQKFLRNGMGYVRETVNFLLQQPAKMIYIPDGWSLSKFKFFAGYDEEFCKRLVVYDCQWKKCDGDYINRGEYIKDAYVVTYVSPYTYINTRNKTQNIYPTFMTSPPSDWKLLKTVNLSNYGIFSRFAPQVYYAK